MKIPPTPFARRALVSIVLACATLLFSAAPLGAVDFFATPAGAGAQDGTSWASAYPQSQVQSALNNLAAGDTLQLGSGTYTLTSLSITGSGAPGSPKSLLGVDTGGGLPLFQGTFNVANSANGARFMSIPGEVHHWVFKNLQFRNLPFVIAMSLSGTTDTLRTHLTFENLSFEWIEDALRLYNSSNITVKNCTAIRYTKRGFRVGDYCAFVSFTGCLADCNAGDDNFPARAIPAGFHVEPSPTHDISFVDCTSRNNRFKQSSTKYWNGDGFGSERGNSNITFLRCLAYDNHDAGFDNKADNISYQDCVSVGNKDGFRHWGSNGQMFNCVAAFNVKAGGTGGSYGLWVSQNNGALTANFVTAHDNQSTQVYAQPGGNAVATINDSVLSLSGTSGGFVSGNVSLLNTATFRPGAGTDPNYVAAVSTWRGEPLSAMDSQTYTATKGFSSTRINQTPNLPPTVAISASTTNGTAPLMVNFSAAAADSDGFIISYVWNFGTGQVSTEANPTAIYSRPGTFTATCTVTDNRGTRASDSIVITATAPTTPVEMRIESGSAATLTDSNGHVWAADHSSDSGGGAVDRGAVEIAGTNDDRLYQTERWGLSNYAILVANGTYNVRLHFAETFANITAAGQRVFSVTAEGAAPAGWTNIDVFAETGGRNIALVKTGTITVADNVLDLAFAASANSAMINGIEIVPTAGGDLPPAPPTGLAASDITASSFTLSWLPATDDVGVSGYDVLRNGAFVGSTTGTSLPVSGLSPYTPYSLTVRTRDLAGNGSVPSAPLVVKTLDDGTVGNDIIIDNTDPFAVDITDDWTSSTFTPGFHGTDYLHDGNTAKGDKSVEFTPDLPTGGTFTVYLWWTAADGRASNTPVDITHAGGTSTVVVNQRINGGAWYSLGTYTLDAGTGNSVLIRTTGTNGTVIADAVRFVRNTPDTQPPSVPTGLAASNVASSSFTLSWAASTDNVGVTGYEVFLDGNSYATPATASVSVTGLSPSTTYSLTVRARDAAGNWSVPSTALGVTTAAPADSTPPSVPTSLAASNITAASFILSWTASTDNAGVTGYEVFIDGVSRATPSGTSASVTGLSPNTTYSATVRARDAAGNWSAQSSALGVTTLAQSGGGGDGRVISVNLSDAANVLAPGDIVGVVPVSHWSNTTANNQALANVVDSTGAVTTADLSFFDTPFAYNNNTSALAEPLTDDAKMMRSQRGRSNATTMSATAAQVPYATYDVYVYWGGRTPQESVPATMTVNFQLWNGAAWVTSETKYIRDNNRVWDGTYNESTATTAAAAVDGNEYVVFRGVIASTFRVSATMGQRTGICGLQIVEQVAPPPVTAPTITGASSASGTYGAPFSYTIVATENPTSYGATGLPAGLTLDAPSGVISGTPAAAGSFTLALSATNAGGTGTGSLALEIARVAQTITFPNPGAKTFGDAPVALDATASSGLPVAYALTSGPATLSGNTVTLTGAGTVTIVAAQAGNANTLPAAPVEISFVVNRAPQTITFPNPGPKTYGDVPFALTATASSGLPVAYALTSGPATLSGNTVTLTGAGTVTIAATQAGDTNFLPAAPASISFEVEPAPAQIQLANLWQLYDGEPRAVTVTTTPAGLAVEITYNGSATPPVYPGSYNVEATVTDPNYVGLTSGAFVVAAGVTVRHAPALDGMVQGSVHVLLPESLALNGGAAISGDLLVPGTPVVQLNGQPTVAGVLDGPGSVEPASFAVTLNGAASLRHLVRRIDPVELPVVAAPPAPAGTRDVVLNNANQSAGDFATLRNLTLNGNAGARAIPPGTYGAFTASGTSDLVLGDASATEPAIYRLQNLTLNGQSRVQLAGPVVLTLANGLTLNGTIGAAGAPEWLLLRVASGHLTLNGGAALHGFVEVPNGTVTLNGSATLDGGVTSDRLVIDGNGRLTSEAP